MLTGHGCRRAATRITRCSTPSIRGVAIATSPTLIACVVLAVMFFGLFIGPKFWVGIVCLGACTVAAGLSTLAYEGLTLLRLGYWTGGEFRDVLAVIGLDDAPFRVGEFKNAMQWFAALPIATGIILSGVFVICVGVIGQIVTLDRRLRGLRRR